jgi:orotidine-5'-phosphate decarboxylase
MMNFLEAIKAAWRYKNTLLCIGLDPDLNKIPSHIRNLDAPFFEFNKAIIDSTHDLVCAYKTQIACYSARGLESDLERTIDYIHEHYPQIPVILDSKRGDVPSTAEMYAMEAFDRYHADAVTVNAYLGSDTLSPFLNRKERGVIILCRTSNPGAGEIQDLESNGKKIYRIIAEKASAEWNYNGNVLLVVGATYPEELGEIRTISGEMPLLVPGIGTQGGDVRKAVINGRDRNGTGMIINSSRAIIYASPETDFAEAARTAALALRDEINRYRS